MGDTLIVLPQFIGYNHGPGSFTNEPAPPFLHPSVNESAAIHQSQQEKPFCAIPMHKNGSHEKYKESGNQLVV